MRKNFFNTGIIIISLFALIFAGTGCKSKQKLAAEQAAVAYAQKVDQAKKSEAERLCKIYTKKASDYKVEMRDDQFAKATLKNYVRLKTKYCNSNS